MPRFAKDSAPRVEESPILVGRYGELDEYTVAFETFRTDADAAAFFRGPSDDRCQSRQLVEFSPAEDYARTMAVVARNLGAAAAS